eukprot:293199-Pelagomonas_calceolata.AAC.3
MEACSAHGGVQAWTAFKGLPRVQNKLHVHCPGHEEEVLPSDDAAATADDTFTTSTWTYRPSMYASKQVRNVISTQYERRRCHPLAKLRLETVCAFIVSGIWRRPDP